MEIQLYISAEDVGLDLTKEPKSLCNVFQSEKSNPSPDILTCAITSSTITIKPKVSFKSGGYFTVTVCGESVPFALDTKKSHIKVKALLLAWNYLLFTTPKIQFPKYDIITKTNLLTEKMVLPVFTMKSLNVT